MTVAFDGGLENYEEIKQRLFEACRANVRLKQRAAIGGHKYVPGYKLAEACTVVAAWALAITIFPYGVASGDFVVQGDLERIVLSGILLVFAVPGSMVAIRDLTFELEVDEDAVRARWLRGARTIPFARTTKVDVRGEALGESLSIVDRSRKKIAFTKFLPDYESVKRYILRRNTLPAD